MRLLVLDFETYFDQRFSLKKLTISEYVHDARFHVHGLAVGRPDEDARFRPDVDACLLELRSAYGTDLEAVTVVCHNAMFDLYVLNHKYGVRPKYFIDTMLLAYHVHGRPDRSGGESASLGALAKRYGLSSKGDLVFLEGVRHPDARQQADLSEYACRDVSITAELAKVLLPRVTRPETELALMMHTVRLFTERSIQVDVQAISRLERECDAGVEGMLEAAGARSGDVSGNASFTRLLGDALARTGRAIPMKAGKRGLIPATAKTDPELQALLGDNDPSVATLACARLGKKSADQHRSRLATLRNIASATGGFLPPLLNYYGAHTGRFSGGGGFNIQNMGRTGTGLQTRQLLVPRPDHKFIIADFAQIEARVTAWLARESSLLRGFSAGEDVYAQFATATFGVQVRKPSASDPPDVCARLSRLRQVGKQAILGLGFSMGAKKFVDTLRGDGQINNMFDTGELNPARCHQIVQDFRRTYPRVQQLWADLSRAMENVVNGGTEAVGPLVFDFRSEEMTTTMTIALPSGRLLRYAQVRWDHTPRTIAYLSEDGTEREFNPDGPQVVYGNSLHLYGGKITENVVQAIARDILVDAVLEVEARGLRVAFHVHDEVVVEVHEDSVDVAKAIVEATMSASPEWAPGLPIACDVQVVSRYGK